MTDSKYIRKSLFPYKPFINVVKGKKGHAVVPKYATKQQQQPKQRQYHKQLNDNNRINIANTCNISIEIATLIHKNNIFYQLVTVLTSLAYKRQFESTDYIIPLTTGLHYDAIFP